MQNSGPALGQCFKHLFKNKRGRSVALGELARLSKSQVTYGLITTCEV